MSASNASTLDDVVNAMTKETNSSTLGWDVVVNYTAEEMNKLLVAAYDAGKPGQLKDISVNVKMTDPITEERYTLDYVFKLGPPLIGFDGSSTRPACQLKIPVIGGSVTITKDNGFIEKPIPGDKYNLNISGIELCSVTGTVGAPRDPKPSYEPFVFNSPNTTGAVSIDIETSAHHKWLKVQIDGNAIPQIDEQRGNLNEKITTFFESEGHSIHWDLAQVNNKLPSDNSTQLVPKKFRFAVYSVDDHSAYTILSLFIYVGHYTGTDDKLQDNWSSQWSGNHYNVPPIPQSYTASIIFNQALISDYIKDSIKSGGMTVDTEYGKTSSDKWGLKYKVHTGKKFEVKEVFVTEDGMIYRIEKPTTVDFDKDESVKGLYVTIGQNSETQANAMLQWDFTYDIHWSMTVVGGGPSASWWGTAKITNKLDKKNFFDDSYLPQYKIHLDASCKPNDWSVTTTAEDHWYMFWKWAKDIKEMKDARPDLPSFSLALLDLDFFMTTNLLLPGQKVIELDNKPGSRFPRDLYLVGQIKHVGEVRARQAELTLAA